MRKSLIFSLKFISTVGISTALPLVAFGLLGRYLDKIYSTGPTLFIVGIVIATVCAFLILRKIVNDAIAGIKKLNKK